MRKIMKICIGLLFEYMPVLFFYALIYIGPDIYIKEISLYISERNFLFVIQGIFWIWIIFTMSDIKKDVPVWNAMQSLVIVELICLLFFAQYHFKVAILLVVFFVAVDFGILHLLKKALKEKVSGKTWCYRYKILIKRVSTLLLFLVLFIPSVMCFCVYGFQQPYSVPTIQKQMNSATSLEYLTFQNKEILQNLKSDTWNILSQEEKLNTLQTVVNIETSYLTIQPLTLKTAKLRKDVSGQYPMDKESISIDSEYLKTASSREAVSTVCHECRHAYQHDVISILDWSDENVSHHHYYKQANEWKVEMENYEDSSGDLDAYYYQNIESDAREYAEDSTAYFMEFVAEP